MGSSQHKGYEDLEQRILDRVVEGGNTAAAAHILHRMVGESTDSLQRVQQSVRDQVSVVVNGDQQGHIGYHIVEGAFVSAAKVGMLCWIKKHLSPHHQELHATHLAGAYCWRQPRALGGNHRDDPEIVAIPDVKTSVSEDLPPKLTGDLAAFLAAKLTPTDIRTRLFGQGPVHVFGNTPGWGLSLHSEPQPVDTRQYL